MPMFTPSGDLPVSRIPLRGSGAALALLAAVVLAACSSTSDKQAKPAALTPIAAPVGLHQAWEVDVGDCEGSFLQPSVQENALYAASRKGALLRIDPATGREIWRVQVEGGIAAGVGSDGLTVAVAGPRGNVVAFDASGARLWEAQASSDIIAPPLVGHALVIVRSTDQRIAAYDIASGKRLWVYQKQQPALSLRIEANMVFVGDSVVVGFPGGRLAAIALANGAGRWEAGVSEPKGATEVERLADVFGVPAVTATDVCSASYQGRIACFDPRSGDLHWAREFSAGTGVLIAGDAVVGVDTASHLSAFTRASGASLWQSSALLNRNLSAPVLIGKYVAVGDLEGKIHLLRLDDGSLAGRFEGGRGALISTPQPWNGGAIIQTDRGRVYLLTLAS